jgi:hypothetical protein
MIAYQLASFTKGSAAPVVVDTFSFGRRIAGVGQQDKQAPPILTVSMTIFSFRKLT